MLEGFWIRNFKSLKQVGIGACFPQFVYIDDDSKVMPYQLGTVTLFAGACGTGKSTVFDAFSFVADCYRHGVDFACLKRGGFDAIYSQGGKGSLSFGFVYREHEADEAATYALSVAAQNDVPFIESELLAYRRGKNSFPIIFLQNGVKSIRYLAPDEQLGSSELTKIEFTDYKHLGLAALESHPAFPVLASFRRLFENWLLSDFTPDPGRGLDRSLPRRQESLRGQSLSGVIRYLDNRYGEGVETLFGRIATRLPGVEAIRIDRSREERPILLFQMTGLPNPVPITLLSDATIRLFTYALLLEEDVPSPLIALDEPENGLDRLHCWKLSEQMRRFVDFPRGAQLFLSTHHPGLADVLHPSQVWILEKNKEGFTVLERAADSLHLQGGENADQPPETRWFSERFEEKL